MPIPLPERPTLADLQTHIREIVDERHWTKDPNEVFILFTEEVGELARELRKKWNYGSGDADKDPAGELADVLMYLLDLANHFEVDLEKAMRAKIAKNEGRTWDH